MSLAVASCSLIFMNAVAQTLATITARIQAAHATRMARLAATHTMPKVGDTVVEGNFTRKAEVVEVGTSIVKARDEDGTFSIMLDSFRSNVRPWRVLND